MDVRLVRWPAAQQQLDELRSAGVPRLVVVDEDIPPPAPSDELEDWIRLPADQSDVRVRVDTLSRRARALTIPQLTADGVLRHGRLQIPLSPTEVRLVERLLARFGAVVSRQRLMTSVWIDERPARNALDAQISRLRRRLADVDLSITTVRGRGYMLEAVSESGQTSVADG